MQLGWLAVLMAGSLGLSGCVGAGCSASNSTSGQEAVCNETGSFSFSTNAGMTSDTKTYTWQNPKTKADVHWTTNLGLGSVSLTLKDSTGKQVFTKSFSGSGQQASSQSTAEGEAGAWTIVVKLTGASGQVAFNVNAG